ncbi:hypothetical protein NL676_004993 [Syzygium grande]|nr:hypothetical protein NL676_004993 [Syzygium grande]
MSPSPKTTLLLLLLLLLLLPSALPPPTAIGVTYSPSSSSSSSAAPAAPPGLPQPDRVAAAVSALKIPSVRLPDPTPQLLRAFLYSNTSLLLSVPNALVPSLAANRSAALSWLYRHVVPFYPRARVSAISVGSNVLDAHPNYAGLLVPALRNFRSALHDLGIRDVAVSTTFSFVNVMTTTFPPSAARFQEPYAEAVMKPLLDFLRDANSSFMVNIYPYNLYRLRCEIPLGFALFQEHPFMYRDDLTTGVRYRNLFDMMVDAVVAAMAVAGHENIPVIVAETGWPSSSPDATEIDANELYSEMYVKGLLGHLRSGQGTPLRKEGVAEAYVYELVDEEAKRDGEPSSGAKLGDFVCEFQRESHAKEPLQLKPKQRSPFFCSFLFSPPDRDLKLRLSSVEMETGIACHARGAFLPAKHSTSLVSPPSLSPSFTSKSLKSSSLFGESLRVAPPRSSLKAPKAKNSSLTTRCEIGDSLEEFLNKATPDKGLIRLLVCMGEALRTISFKVRTASCGGTACINSFGDEQLAVDVLADKLLFEALQYSHFCKYACSEEVPELQDMGGPVEGGFSVAFDPLDGSSIVDTNFTVGTIFGVWPGDKLTGVTGRDQVAAAMGIYGPRTTYVLALKDIPGPMSSFSSTKESGNM